MIFHTFSHAPVHWHVLRQLDALNVMLDAFLIRTFLCLTPPEHQNYFGVDDNLGPVAVSIRRERLDDGKEKDGMQFNYRVTFRTSQVKYDNLVCSPSALLLV